LDHARKTWVQEMDNGIYVGFFFFLTYLKLFLGQKIEGDSQGVSTRKGLEGPVGVQAEAIGTRRLVVGGGERGVLAVVDEGSEEGRNKEGNRNKDGNDVAVRVGGGVGVGEEVRDVGWEGGEGIWVGVEVLCGCKINFFCLPSNAHSTCVYQTEPEWNSL
jgi:hypothetical protein